MLFIIEHDMEFVFELAQRIIVMNRGRIIADGKPEDIIPGTDCCEKICMQKE
jgi:ABC-type branched-subunit amino acid transport system ATPase component